MRNFIPVEKAIKVGRIIKYSTGALIVLIGYGSIFFIPSDSPFIIINLFLTLFAFLFLTNYILSKWKLWAFKNVLNVRELKERAIQEMLMYRDSSFMEKVEFKSKNEKANWEKVLLQFEKTYAPIDNKDIPNEYKIHYSISKNIFGTIGYLAMGGLFLMLLMTESQATKTIVFLSIFFLFSVYQTISKILKVINRKVIILIDKKGITLNSSEFYNWKHITNEQIISGPDHSEFYFLYLDKEKSANLKNLDINLIQFEQLLETYRARYEKTATNTA